MRSRILVCACAFFVTACHGTIREFPDQGWAAADSDASRGIRVYQMVLMKVRYHTTTIIDDTTKQASYACTPKEMYKLEARPDYDHPLRVRYDSGLFETNQFAITLSPDQVLTGVSVQSTPPTAQISSIAPLITAAAALAKATVVAGKPPECTSNPEVISIEPVKSSGG